MFAGIFASSMQPLVGFVDSDLDGDQQSSYTMSLDFGAIDVERMLVAFIGIRDNSFGVLPNFTSVTIGGVAASIIQNDSRSQWRLGVAVAEVPTGTSGNVVTVLTGSANNCDVSLYSARRLRAGVVDSDITDGSGTSLSLSLTMTGGGGVAACTYSDQGVGTVTWTGATSDLDVEDSEGDKFSSAHADHLATSAAYAIQASQTQSFNRLLVAVTLF